MVADTSTVVPVVMEILLLYSYASLFFSVLLALGCGFGSHLTSELHRTDSIPWNYVQMMSGNLQLALFWHVSNMTKIIVLTTENK